MPGIDQNIPVVLLPGKYRTCLPRKWTDLSVTTVHPYQLREISKKQKNTIFPLILGGKLLLI